MTGSTARPGPALDAPASAEREEAARDVPVWRGGPAPRTPAGLLGGNRP